MQAGHVQGHDILPGEQHLGHQLPHVAALHAPQRQPEVQVRDPGAGFRITVPGRPDFGACSAVAELRIATVPTAAAVG